MSTQKVQVLARDPDELARMLECDSGGRLYVTVSDWEIVLISNEALDANDKLITVPARREWQVLWIWVEYTSDANVGDRQLEISLLDPANDEIGSVVVGATQAAGLTRFYMIGPALADLDAFRDTAYLMTPLPPTVFLTAGESVRVFDNNLVSPGDDIIIQMKVARRITG